MALTGLTLAGAALAQNPRIPTDGRPAAPLPDGGGDRFYERRRIKRTAPLDPAGGLTGRWDRLYDNTDSSAAGIRAAFCDWDDNYLYLGVETGEATEVRFDIDGANDGWFRGADNLSVRIAPSADSASGCLLTAQRFDTIQNRDRPVWAASPIPADAIRGAQGKTASGVIVTTLAIPRTELFGLKRKSGSNFGLRIDAGLGVASSGDSQSLAQKPLLRLELSDTVDAAGGGLTVRFLARDRQIVPGEQAKATLEVRNEGKEPMSFERLYYRGSLGVEGKVDSANFTGVTLQPGQKYSREIRSAVADSVGMSTFVLEGGALRDDGQKVIALTAFDRVEPYAVGLDIDDNPVEASAPDGPARKRLAAISIRSRSDVKAGAKVTLILPPGWSVEGGETIKLLGFSFASEVKTASYKMIAPVDARPGSYTVEALVEIGARRYTTSAALRVVP